MVSTITEALIARSIQTARMVEAGREYWTRGRVRQLSVAPAHDTAHATVQGEHVYQVDLRFGPADGSGVSSQCTCPVGSGCKHAAAVLFALRARAAGDQAPSKTGRLLPAPPPLLPPALSQWLGAMAPLLAMAGAEGRPATRAIYYVLRAQALTSSARMGAKRTAASLADPGRPVRLLVEVQDVTLDREGRPIGAGAKVQPHQMFHAVGGLGPMTAQDQLIVRRLNARLGETDYEGCLTGVGGFDLLTRIVETGRARWGGPRGPALTWHSAMASALGWTHDGLGHAVLAVTPVPPDRLVGLLAPPVLIDPGSGAVSPVDTGVAPVVAEQLLRLPPVAPNAVQALALRWKEAAPPSVPPPLAPEIEEKGRLQPTPVLQLLMQRVQFEDWGGRRWGGRTSKADCAVARLSFDYGAGQVGSGQQEVRLLVRAGERLIRFSRNLEAEAAALQRLVETELTAVPDFEEARPTPAQEWDHAPSLPADAEAFTGFLLGDAVALRREGWRVELTPDFPLRLVEAAADAIEVALKPSGMDWFDLELSALVEGERIDLVPALGRLLSWLSRSEADELMRRTPEAGARLPVALGDGRVVALDASRVLPLLRAMLLLADPDQQPGRQSPPRLARRDLGLLAELESATQGLAWTGAEALRTLARALTELRFSPTPLPDGFKAALRPYQQTGVDWLDALARAGFGGLLADDMGLGKTVQTLAHLSVLQARGDLAHPVLIVAPTSVLPNWQSEVARFTPDLPVIVLHGPDRRGRHEEVGGAQIVLTSYPLLVRDREALAGRRFSLVIFDEAHNLKNPRTASHAAAKALLADRTLALTGTPVENRLGDAWALFDLVAPGLLGRQREFAQAYRGVSDGAADVAARGRLARKIRPFLLRRTKEGVAGDLPPKSVVPLSIALHPAQMALHEGQRLLMQKRVQSEIARVGLMRAQILVLTALTRLRQICCDPRLVQDRQAKATPSAKLERLLELLDELIPEGRRIVLFSQFTSMLDLIKPELESRSIAWVELTGKTKDRKTPVACFQAGDIPLILVSLKAGGTGLNLTAADTVILYDPWWNPAIEAQAIDRAHRLGQSKPVFVYRMVAADSVEEKILALQARKAALAQALWSEDASAAAALTEEDVAFLLS